MAYLAPCNQGLFTATPRRGHAVCTLQVHPPTSPCPTLSAPQNLSPEDIAIVTWWSWKSHHAYMHQWISAILSLIMLVISYILRTIHGGISQRCKLIKHPVGLVFHFVLDNLQLVPNSLQQESCEWENLLTQLPCTNVYSRFDFLTWVLQ